MTTKNDFITLLVRATIYCFRYCFEFFAYLFYILTQIMYHCHKYILLKILIIKIYTKKRTMYSTISKPILTNSSETMISYIYLACEIVATKLVRGHSHFLHISVDRK